MKLTRAEKREEKLERKKRETLVREEGRLLVELNSTLDIEMWSKVDLGSNILHQRLDGLNKVRDMPIEGFPSWKLSFNPEKDPENLSLGHLVLIYAGEGANYYVELNRYSDNIARILLKEIEIRNFINAVIEGMKGIASAFDEEFCKELSSLSAESRAILNLAIEKTKRAVRIERSASGIFRKGEWLVFPSFEFTLLNKTKVDEIRRAATA